MIISPERLAKLATISLECLPEDISVRGQCASGDDAQDREMEDSIAADYNAGNEWAWCCAKVTAEYAGQTGTAYLGCCSYESERAFRADPYFADLCSEALTELADELKRAHNLYAALAQAAA